MIDLGTIAGLHEHKHELHAYCPRCGRWAVLDLAQLIHECKGAMRRFRVRCKDCGTEGVMQVRPPQPTRGPGGWGELPIK